ncbi:hypothetical protein EDD11_007923 [Mortierella claussenii]|nr:hypothetical protein EDD11_007923 [Mortierella claussenii]
MLKSAALGPSSASRQLTPGRRPSPSSSLSSAESSPTSTLSTKEQRQLQLQVLRQQQQQQQHFRVMQQQRPSVKHFLDANQYNQSRQAPTHIEEGKSSWTSQEIKDTWVNIDEKEEDNERLAPLERRQSPLSDDKHMNISAMKLLSDETPPDDMDGSWGLDGLDDDEKHPHDFQINNPTPTRQPNEQNDRNISKNNNDHTTIINKAQSSARTGSAHGYVHMGKVASTHGGQSRSRPSTALERNAGSPLHSGSHRSAQDVDGSGKDVHSDISHHSRRDPPLTRKDIKTSKYPWRNSKHETIFTNLVDDHALMEQLRGQNAQSAAPRPQSIVHGSHRQNRHTSEAETSSSSSSSLSLGEIIDAVNKGEDSLDPARSSKFKQAKHRLAGLPSAKDLQENSDEALSPAMDSSASRMFQSNQEAFQQQRLRVLRATKKIDPSDDRSLAPSGEQNGTGQAHLEIKTAITPSRQSTIPVSSRSSRFSYGSRHRSQNSRDTEIGDRGSTTSRDSAYRDSLSGSTLGSAGFQAQLDGIQKHELATVFVALKSAAAGQIFSSDPVTKEQSPARILPHNVNDKTTSLAHPQGGTSATHQAATSEAILSEDTDTTPRPAGRSPFGQQRRLAAEEDPARDRQYAALASKGLSKQTSSFVEELANATALKSATDLSFKNTASPDLKVSKRPTPRRLDEQHDDIDLSVDRNDCHIAFNATSTLNQGKDCEQLDADTNDLASLAGSRALENAFRSLQDLDMTFNTVSEADKRKSAASRSNRREQTDDEDNGDYLSAVLLPSKPKRKGEHSLKWENQVEMISNADSSHFDIDANISRSSSHRTFNDASGMVAEQSSFSHARGQLTRVITGIYPWDEWDQVRTLDLSKSGIESTITLNQQVPKLDVLILNDNQVPHLTGVPKSVKTLQARSNLLDNLTNFGHLANLQYLDISNNTIEDLTGLSSLVHLRELTAEGNKIKSVSALQQMDGLIRLDISHNCLTSLDFRWSKMQRLEFLNASHNKIEQLENLESLGGLIHANLAHNCIEDISLVQPLRRLRILRLSENKLVTFDATPFPGLRTLYLDDNRLQSLENCQKLTRLENFSVRDQEGEGIAIDMTEFINSRKLYLSGNPVHALEFEMGFYRLEYLEICAGCLSELPVNFATLFPNLRGLNLSYNELDSISALDGLHRLRRLIFVGNNLKSSSEVLPLVSRMRSLVTLDFRHNPMTSNMYPAMSIRQGSKYQDTYRSNQNSETELDWRRRDVGFRRALPDAMYVRRSVYRSTIIKYCKRLEWFDGGDIQVKERERVPIVLGGMWGSYSCSYLPSNRREDEDEEEEFEFGANYDEYYLQDEFADEQQEAEWLQNQTLLQQQLNEQDGGLDEDEGYDHDDRDPEDITDHSKRQGSSIDSDSMNGQLQQQQYHSQAPKSPLSRLSSASQLQPKRQQQSHQMRSQSGFLLASPSPKGPVLSSRTASNTARIVANRMSSNSTLSQQQQEQEQYAADTPYSSTHITSRRKASRRTLPAEHPGEGEVVNEHQSELAETYYEGSSDKRSAVKNWRDEVNEVSQLKPQSTRVVASAGAGASREVLAGPQVPRSKSQQMRRRSDKASMSGSSSSSGSHGSQNGRAGALHARLVETSTIAVANDSDEKRPSKGHRAGSQKFNIPVPPPQPLVFQPQPQQPQRPSLMTLNHRRRRSDGTVAVMASPTVTAVRPLSASAHLTRSNSLMSRPHSQHGMLGFENTELVASPMYHSQQLPSQYQLHQQLPMSPMGGPNGMTSSGTLLRHRAHQRRRSFAVYPHGSANARKKELLGSDVYHHLNNNSPGAALTTSMSLQMLPSQSPMPSPGYFSINHHGMQSAFGSGKGSVVATPTALGWASSGKSLPNTPSRSGGGGGRASRVSLGAGPHGYPQTLARDMERNEMAA